MSIGACPFCDGELERRFSWSSPPLGETLFELPSGSEYSRQFLQCARCAHLIADADFDLDAIYGGAYVDATYSGDGIDSAYERIMSLPAEASDNSARVERVCEHMPSGEQTLLDVGSGRVFAARMKERGWAATVIDPDQRAVDHARDRVGVNAILGDFMQVEPQRAYRLLSFNKVLEHVHDPGAMLAHAGAHLADGGRIYVEVPDGELAAEAGPEREEFFIEHHHAFSLASLALMSRAQGYALERTYRLSEPSGKYTLAAFLIPLPTGSGER